MGMEQDVADEGEDQARPPGQQGGEVEEVFGEAGAFASGQALESGLSLEGWGRITVAGSGRRQRRVDQRVGDAALRARIGFSPCLSWLLDLGSNQGPTD